MTFTYDPTTDLGKVRLLCLDSDSTHQIYSDAEVQAFLDMSNAVVRYAAANALDTIAGSQALILKATELMDLKVDGTKVAAALQKRAAELRRQEDEGDGDYTGLFDYAEMVGTPGQWRERLINQWMRAVV